MHVMPRDLYLPLYGRLSHGPEEDLAWNLYQTDALARLRDISLACIPSRYVPHGQAASRFQHSVGASVLARQLCRQESELAEYRDLLIAACLLHDCGSPPFSHVVEPFLYAHTGQHHEQSVARLLQTGGEVAEILERYGVPPGEALDVICGHGALGPLVAGSIDLDNLDNSLHLLVSLGYTGKLPYRPQRITAALRYEGGQPFIQLDDLSFAQLLGWRAARHELYGRLSSLAYMASTSMLYRAVDLADAQGALTEDFFALDESQSITLLQQVAGADAILAALEHWRQYVCVHWAQTPEEDERLAALYSDVARRSELADALASSLDLRAEQLCLYVGREKEQKAIELDFRGEAQLVQAATRAFAASAPQQRVAVFVDKRAGIEPRRAREAWRQLVDDLQPAAPTHCFF